MLRQPSSTLTAIAALLVALVAGAGFQPSRAAANACLSAPNGAAPNGQHWYYHLDRTDRRKCWYLRELTATPAADAVSAPAEADRTAPSADTAATPADSVAAVHPRGRAAALPPVDTAAPPTGAAGVKSNTSPTDESAAAFDASRPADTKKAPLPAATDPSSSQAAATVWADPPPASVGVLGPDAPTSNGPPAPVSNVTGTHATSMTTKDKAVAQRDAAQVTAAAPDEASAKAVVPNLLVIALAAALAVAVSTTFKLVRRRRPVTGETADFVAHLGSKPDRRSVRSRLATAEAVSAQPVPIQSTLIPEQLAMMRPSAASRRQARLNR